jgi:hypothetical protein
MYKFYTDLTFEAATDHRQDNWSIDNPYSYRQWYSEDIQDKDTLLITVGDSWTWGDHLGRIDWKTSTDDPIRLTQIYGRLLANSLNSDWVNLARPGCSNYWMLEQLQNIHAHLLRVKDNYKKIYVVVALTEDLREATYSRRIQVDGLYQGLWTRSIGVTDFLVQVEHHLLQNLETYFNQLPFVTAHVQRAFTDIWPANTSSLLLEKSWCDVIQDRVKFNNYQRPVPFIGQMAVNPLTEKYIVQNPERKAEFLRIMDMVETRWNFLGESDYNLKGSTYHPNPAGHAVWADYLFSQIR